MLSIGIVLKSDSEIVFLFDKYKGKICCRTQKRVPVCGALVQYDLQKKRARFFVDRFELLDVPFELAKRDILFLHHLFEFCFYSLVYGACSKKTFSLLIQLYVDEHLFFNNFYKKIFLFKCFISLGIAHGNRPFSPKLFYWLCSESIDSIVSANLHLEIEHTVDAWLYKCVGAHPYYKDFKTIHFLKKIRMP